MSKKSLKRNDSLIGLTRRKRRRNMIRAIPIVAAVVALAAVVAYEYSANGPKAMVLHIHPHLSITFDGQPLTIPSHIGMDYSLWKDNTLNQYGIGMSPLHTHDTSGTIHVESNAYRTYTLGQFLDIWGGLDTNGKTVKTTVDGKPVSDYRDIILRDGEQIHMAIS
jgi:hypothetical protein